MTFKDEWLFYALMFTLFELGHYLMMIPVGIIGAVAIANSYRRQWALEDRCFGNLFAVDQKPELTDRVNSEI